MAIVVTCSRGHVSHLSDELAGGTARCLECDELLAVPERGPSLPENSPLNFAETRPDHRTNPDRARKGLWQLMQPPPPAAVPPESGSDEKLDEPPPATGRGFGLWTVMGKGVAADQVRSAEPNDAAASRPPGVDPFRQAFPGADRRLRSLQERTAPPPPQSTRDSRPPESFDSELEPLEIGALAAKAPPNAAHAPVAAPLLPVRPEPREQPALPPRRARNAVVSLILGCLAVPLSALAIIPAFWSTLPATGLGFAALILGFTATGEIRRSRGQMTGRAGARAGIVLGIAGILLGPSVLSRLQIWENASRRYTEMHLRQIGLALGQYHDAQAAFPPGGLVVDVPQTGPRPLYGWMTSLLPFLGERELFSKIDPNLSYRDPANAPAFGQTVPAFLAAGSSTQPRDGFGVTHFAGVGGELALPDGGFAHVGIFGENSDVSRDDVSDGLSYTLAAGEIAYDFPAWGDPENWRMVGKGLNREAKGFGNASHTGAAFLMADGSVRFFSNATSPDLLEKLSTRDGEEPLPSSAHPVPDE